MPPLHAGPENTTITTITTTQDHHLIASNVFLASEQIPFHSIAQNCEKFEFSLPIR
jgi:hypothetical protein